MGAGADVLKSPGARVLRVGLLPALALGGCSDRGPAGDPAAVVTDGPVAALFVTVALSDQVLRLDPETGAILARIPLDPRPSESDEPHGVVISPGGEHWYATLAHGRPTLSKFERRGDRQVGRVPLDAAGAARVELDREGQTAFVADYDRSRPGEPGEVLTIRFRYSRSSGDGLPVQPARRALLEGIRSAGRSSGFIRLDALEHLGGGRFRARVALR